MLLTTLFKLSCQSTVLPYEVHFQKENEIIAPSDVLKATVTTG